MRLYTQHGESAADHAAPCVEGDAGGRAEERCLAGCESHGGQRAHAGSFRQHLVADEVFGSSARRPVLECTRRRKYLYIPYFPCVPRIDENSLEINLGLEEAGLHSGSRFQSA